MPDTFQFRVYDFDPEAVAELIRSWKEIMEEDNV